MTTLTSHRTNPIVDSNLSRDLMAGVVTGQIAGLIMAVVMALVFTVFLGKTPWFPVQVIGSVVFGDQALVGFHLPAFLAGLVVHQAGPTLLWSLVFGWVISELDRSWSTLAAVGAAIAVSSQIIDVEMVMPPLMRALHGHDLWAENVPSAWSWAAHLVFGLGFLLFIPVRARLARPMHR